MHQPKKFGIIGINPSTITKWNFANDDWSCCKATNDLMLGEKLATRIETKDGSFVFDFEGVYDKLVPQKKIRYKVTDGRSVSTLFEDLNGKTKVTNVFDAESCNPADIQRAGWQANLDNFKKYTENNQPIIPSHKSYGFFIYTFLHQINFGYIYSIFPFTSFKILG